MTSTHAAVHAGAFFRIGSVVEPTSADVLDMEAEFAAGLVGGSIALSFGLAFGVLRLTLRTMAASAVTASTRSK